MNFENGYTTVVAANGKFASVQDDADDNDDDDADNDVDDDASTGEWIYYSYCTCSMWLKWNHCQRDKF